MKVISFAVPCYNSEAYMKKCVESLLFGGEKVEIIIVDDGSTDRTGKIADAYATDYPDIVKVIHQENGGHGEAVNTGLKNATGKFFKVVDSDDWVDKDSYRKILKVLEDTIARDRNLDMLIANYVYEKVGAIHKKVMKQKGFPKNTYFTWGDIGRIKMFHYILMHSIIYRTEMLKDMEFKLPAHTFYVDNIFAYTPLLNVKDIYYLNTNFYRYYIGRSDQSVNESVMLKRIDQQIRVNKIMIDNTDIDEMKENKQRKYMLNYLEIVTTVTCVMLRLRNSEENNKQEKGTYLNILKLRMRDCIKS